MNIAIIGSGPGGYVAAIRASQLGIKVTVIEDSEVGGTCLNWGCIPTKTLVASSQLFSQIKKLGDFGIELKGEAIPNFARMIKRKDKIVSTLVKGTRTLFKSWQIQLKEGRGMLLSPEEIKVIYKDGTREKIQADKIIIATGSRPSQMPEVPYDGFRILSSNEALALTEVPKSILIIGAGVIGCEFASIFQELGSQVTIVEMLPRAVSTEDIEISEFIEKVFKKRGITLYKNVMIKQVEIKDDGVHALIYDRKEIFTERVLVGTETSLNSDRIGIEGLGIQKSRNGEIIVNNKMETTVPGVYAVGDVTGGPLLAHAASKQGITAVRNLLGGDENIDYSVIPSAIFTSPEIASVGMREHEAGEKGIQVNTGHFPFRALGKAQAIGEIEGFIKVVSDKKTDRVLGVHIVGPHASDIIHEAALAIQYGLKVKDIANAVHIHPTLSEGLKEAADDVYGEAIHLMKK